MMNLEYHVKPFHPQSKVMLFSHNDLDGVACGIVTKLAFPEANVMYCGYHNVDERVKDFVQSKEYEKYDLVFITDISVSEEVEKLINEHEGLTRKLKLLDHHATAMHLNENDWAFVHPMGRHGINSGTNLLFDYLVSKGMLRHSLYFDGLHCFVEKVRRYDSWEWYNLHDDQEASALNDLFWLYGWKVFERQYIYRFTTLKICKVMNGSWVDIFSHADKKVLDVDASKKKDYISRKQKQMITGNLLKYRAGFVFAEQYISELGNKLSENNPELDLIVIFDMGNKKVSYRTIHDHIDLGKDVAKHFGGGGHAKASGSQLDDHAVKMIIPMVFGGKKLLNQLVSLITGKGFIGKIGKLVDFFTKK